MKSGLNGVAMPRFGLILSGSTATASGMPLGALGGRLQTAKNLPKTLIFMFLGSLGGDPPCSGHAYCPTSGCTLLLPSYCPFAGCCYVAFLPNNRRTPSLAAGQRFSEVTERHPPNRGYRAAPAKGELGSQRSQLGPNMGGGRRCGWVT